MYKLDEKIMNNEFKNQLAAALDGLSFTGESDAQFELLNHKEVNADAFFERLTKIEDWHEEQEKAIAKKFADLKALLDANTSGVQIVKIGKIEIEYFIGGFDKTGEAFLIRTRAIET